MKISKILPEDEEEGRGGERRGGEGEEWDNCKYDGLEGEKRMLGEEERGGGERRKAREEKRQRERRGEGG